jgi:hypothetical protein
MVSSLADAQTGFELLFKLIGTFCLFALLLRAREFWNGQIARERADCCHSWASYPSAAVLRSSKRVLTMRQSSATRASRRQEP